MDHFLIEEFKSYKVTLYSNVADNHEAYSIHLRLPSGVAVLKFVGGTLPPNSYLESVNKRSRYELYVKAERFADFIDILRNEKPLFFYFNAKTTQGYITTSDEPVGEGENENDED